MTEGKRGGALRRLFTRRPAETFAGATVNGIPVLDLAGVWSVLADQSGDVTVSRAEANRLAPVVAVRNRIQAVMIGMPLVQSDRDGVERANKWLESPNPLRPRANEIADTVADMYYEGSAYWLVTKRGPGANGPESGFPVASRWVPFGDVSTGPDGSAYVATEKVDPRNLLKFEGIHAGILHEGANGAINDALRLERTAAMFTNSPFPLGYFQTREGARPLETDEGQEFLQGWIAARRRNAWGIVPEELELKTVDVDPAKLQLGEARKQTTSNIALAGSANLEDVGVSTTSRVYFNATQIRKDQLDFQIAQYAEPIAQRLSMPDCTPTGHVVKFSTDEFLSVDELTRMQIYTQGRINGAYADADEVRVAERKPPLTDAQKAARAASKASGAADGGRRTTDPGASTPPPQQKGTE